MSQAELYSRRFSHTSEQRVHTPALEGKKLPSSEDSFLKATSAALNMIQSLACGKHSLRVGLILDCNTQPPCGVQTTELMISTLS